MAGLCHGLCAGMASQSGRRARIDECLLSIVLWPKRRRHGVSIPAYERASSILERELANRGVRTGVNFLVARSNLEAARRAAVAVRAEGIGNDRIIYLPLRGRDTPTPQEVAAVAGNTPFQSMTCLAGCGRSPRFCSVGWDKTVAWCSYTKTRAPLRLLTYAGLETALSGLGIAMIMRSPLRSATIGLSSAHSSGSPGCLR